jgi:uncharacterized protein involved in exopolysaccharide biosynthesis
MLDGQLDATTLQRSRKGKKAMRNETDESAGRSSFDLSSAATAFFRHKKKVIAFVAAIGALAVLVIVFAPRKYRSEARLFLQVGRESIRLDPTATTGQTIALQQSGRDNEVATALEVLRGRAILEQTVDALTPEVVLGESGSGKADPNLVAETALAPLRYAVGMVRSIDPISKHEEAVLQVLQNFAVDAEHDSTIISLTYDAETPELAQEVLQVIVEVYRNEHVRLHQTSGSKPFFTQQRDELEAQLEAAEAKLRDTKNRMGFASIDSRRNTLETRIGAIDLARNGAIQSIASAKARIDSLSAQASELPERMHVSTTQMPNTGADALRAQLYTLQVELMNLEAKYNADHPLVASTRAQVEEARSMLQGEEGVREKTTDSVNDNLRALQLDLAKAEAGMAGYQAQLSELETQRTETLAELRQVNDYEVELQDLDRTVNLARTNFYGYASDLEQARVDEELNRHQITNVAVAQDATLVQKPVSPSKLLVVAMALAMATVGTGLLVLGCEKMGSRVHSASQLEDILRLPVLATVPEGRPFAAAAGRP